MGIITEIRVRIIEFIKRYRKTLVMAFFLVIFITTIDQVIGNIDFELIPSTTRKDNVATLSEEPFPARVDSKGRDKIEEFLDLCNQQDFIAATDMISSDCMINEFSEPLECIGYLKTLFPHKRKYHVQAYMKLKNDYIYQVKIFDDIIKTGLTEERFEYDDEKIIIKEKDGKLELNIRGYIGSYPIQGMYEDENIKVELLENIVSFTSEKILVRLKNRTDKTIVLNDFDENKGMQITLDINGDRRQVETENVIKLDPYTTKEVLLQFPKLEIDETAELPSKLEFNNIRIYKEYLPITNFIKPVEEQKPITTYETSIKIEY